MDNKYEEYLHKFLTLLKSSVDIWDGHLGRITTKNAVSNRLMKISAQCIVHHAGPEQRQGSRGDGIEQDAPRKSYQSSNNRMGRLHCRRTKERRLSPVPR